MVEVQRGQKAAPKARGGARARCGAMTYFSSRAKKRETERKRKSDWRIAAIDATVSFSFVRARET
jgi:hypothetical protein